MQDHPLQVPKGWIRGEPLRYSVRDRSIEVWQYPTAAIAFERLRATGFMPDDIHFIRFRTLTGFFRFAFWWGSNER